MAAEGEMPPSHSVRPTSADPVDLLGAADRHVQVRDEAVAQGIDPAVDAEVLAARPGGEHLWAVGRALYGEGTAQTTAWAGQRISDLRATGAAPVLRALAEATPPTPEAAAVLRREREQRGDRDGRQGERDPSRR